MGCCASSDGKVDDTPLIIDVERVLADAAWDMYYHSLPRWRRVCLRRKNFRVDVPMNYFKFKVTKEECPLSDETEREEKPARHNQNGTNVQTPTKTDAGWMLKNKIKNRRKTSPEIVGLETEFKNSTGEKQTYNFKCEKTRKSTMSVTCQKGFSMGGKINFALGLPKVLADGKLSNEVDMRVSVTKTTGDSFEKTLTTCATSDITVAAHSHYTATVTMDERHLQAGFKVWVTMSMPAKKAKIVVYNKREEPVHFHTLKNLPELFSEDNHLYDKNNELRDDEVEFVIEGQVDGIQLCSHSIDLVEHDKTTDKKQQ